MEEIGTLAQAAAPRVTLPRHGTQRQIPYRTKAWCKSSGTHTYHAQTRRYNVVVLLLLKCWSNRVASVVFNVHFGHINDADIHAPATVINQSITFNEHVTNVHA